MRRQLLIIIIISYSLIVSGQNLVTNPSFEEHTFCPNSSNQVYECIGWNSFGNSPDYFNSCSTTLGFAPPNSMWGYQVPHSGGAYTSLVTYSTYNPNYREIIGNTLANSLIIGQKYFFSFFVNYAFEPLAGGVASNKVGLKFLTGSYSMSNITPINDFAHLYTDSILSDTLIWVKVSGSFIADSTYNYLAIGNFFQDSLTDTIHIGTALPEYAMYYIDDVCVTTDSLYNEIWTGIPKDNKIENYFNVFPNPTSGKINIDFPNRQDLQLYIYSIDGRLIIQNEINKNKNEIDISTLAKGIYIIKLTSADWTVQRKLIKE